MNRINLQVRQRTPDEIFFQGVLDRSTIKPFDESDSTLKYYADGEQINLAHDTETNMVWIRSGLWNSLKSTGSELHNLLKNMVEEHYHIGSVTINWF